MLSTGQSLQLLVLELLLLCSRHHDRDGLLNWERCVHVELVEMGIITCSWLHEGGSVLVCPVQAKPILADATTSESLSNISLPITISIHVLLG